MLLIHNLIRINLLLELFNVFSLAMSLVKRLTKLMIYILITTIFLEILCFMGIFFLIRTFFLLFLLHHCHLFLLMQIPLMFFLFLIPYTFRFIYIYSTGLALYIFYIYLSCFTSKAKYSS